MAAAVEADRASDGLVTPETYLGWGRLTGRFANDRLEQDVRKRYEIADSVPQNYVSFGGEWTIEKERAVAGQDAVLRLHFHARDIHLVLGGRGTVEAFVDGVSAGTTQVVKPQLYTLLRLPEIADATLELRFSPGVSGYAFTFG